VNGNVKPNWSNKRVGDFWHSIFGTK